MPADPRSDFPSAPASPTESAQGKWWGQSMTIWGVMLTALSTVLPVVGPIVGLDLTADLIEQLGRDLVLLAQAAGGLVGTILTILGRVRASTALARLPVRLKL